jgi:hypothetical protein
VRNKIFAGLSRDGTRGNLKLTYRRQLQLREENAAAFAPCEGAWGKAGWTYVELAHVDFAQLKAAMREAWCLIAPKALVATVGEPVTRVPKPRPPRSRPRKSR